MTLVRPVPARLVTAHWAPRVVSPLHDVLTEDQRRATLAENPDSYLHVTSDPLVPLSPPDDRAVGEHQAHALARLLGQGAYRCLGGPSVFVYRMRERGRDHVGVVAGVDLGAFADGRVLGHERVQDRRVDALVRHFHHVPMRSELVALFHRADAAVTELTTRVRDSPALLEFTDTSGVQQSVWRAGAEEAVALAHLLDGHQHYIADGHHRVAAALRFGQPDLRPSHGQVLCALYPQDQLSVHAFHRRVRGPVPSGQLLGALEPAFDVRRAAGPEVGPGSIGLYAAGGWLLLTPRARRTVGGVAGLDVTVLDDLVLRPLLGIEEGDPRVEFLPGPVSLDRAIRACDEDGGVLFTLHAPGLDDLVTVAERREVMSPKTTHVVPKPRTGIFLQETGGPGDGPAVSR